MAKTPADSKRADAKKLLAMRKTMVTGRASIFRGKVGGQRVQGVITKPGSIRFTEARKRLAKLAAFDPEHVSDADVIEYLAIGEAETIAYLEKVATS